MSAKSRWYKNRILWQTLLCVLILAVFGSVAVLLMSMKKPPEKVTVEIKGPLVNTEPVRFQSHRVIVQGYGEVEAMDTVAVVPQVSGRIVKVHPSLVDGGFFKADETLIEIERDDYELAVRRAVADLHHAEVNVTRAKASVQSAQTALQVEQAEAEAALIDWREQHGDRAIPPLVARRPQLAEKRAAVESAKGELAGTEAQVDAAETALGKAELDLARTRIALPFDGRVMEESVDEGQYLVAGQPIAAAYRTDRVKIVIPLENDRLAWFSVPLAGESPGSGASATVSAVFAGRTCRWRGQVVRTAGQIDPRSRLVHVIVEVDRPFERIDGRPPLSPGMFVNVAIEGRLLDRAAAIPRYALRDGNHVWQIVDGRLKVTEVDVVRLENELAWIGNGLDDRAIIITDHLEAWTDGMKVRTIQDEAGASEPGQSPRLAGEVNHDE